MSPFWKVIFENLEDRGRGIKTFIIMLAVAFGLCLGAALMEQSALRDWIVAALPWVGVAFMIWLTWTIRRARARGRERLQRSPLSDDELLKAQMKLRNPR